MHRVSFGVLGVSPPCGGVQGAPLPRAISSPLPTRRPAAPPSPRALPAFPPQSLFKFVQVVSRVWSLATAGLRSLLFPGCELGVALSYNSL